ncbi:helix-turn-helix domain-containing protein [Mycobacterium hubeiense]|uniref:helix-turn-helix domain-containing protein n=1 Tax=Mycobacterium hubeiense TaxID=1867256 RepID=UPI000C7F072D|nr:helix-turn-helix domain-containing protein [Mycobacterium sp. QGD 101]
MTDEDHEESNGPLRQWYARTLRVALAKEGLSRIQLHQQLVERFGDRAPSQTSVYRLVSGEQLPRTSHLIMIARLLDISPRDLVPEDGRLLTG